MKKITLCYLVIGLQSLCPLVSGQDLFTKTGSDLTWSAITEKKLIPIGETSTTGITGSTIDVNNEHPVISSSPYKNRPIDNNIAIHVLGNESVPRADFPKWTRWYQEDGNTQVFRLFKDEINVRNTVWYKPRIESELPDHSVGTKIKNNAEWAEWSGTYTFVKPINAEIFQIWGNDNYVLMLHMDANGKIQYNPRDGSGFKTMAENATGKSLNVRVRDYGTKYEVYLEDKLFATNTYKRTSAGGHFRWGIYHTGAPVAYDCMIFVTGAQFRFSNTTAIAKPTKILRSVNTEAFVERVDLNGKKILQTDAYKPATGHYYPIHASSNK